MKIIIALPVYNEQLVLEKNAQAMRLFCNEHFSADEVTIVIADNGSTDQTPVIGQQLAVRYSNIKYISTQRGKGSGWKTAFQRFDADCYVMMDVDLAVGLTDLLPLVAAIKNGADLVIGSRWIAGARVEREWWRSLNSWLYRRTARLMLRSGCSDFQCGFKALNLRARNHLLPQTQDTQFFLDTELIALAEASAYSIVEVPVHWSAFRDRRRSSKISLKISDFAYLKQLWLLRQRKLELLDSVDKNEKVV